jgi:hypothetical protein
VNPFAVLGLPEWPDLDDQTVHAAWQQVAADTSPARPDGGDLAKYAQASAAYAELDTPQGRAAAYAALAAATDFDDDPGDDLAGGGGGDGGWMDDQWVPVIVVPVVVVPEPVPLREVARTIAEIPSRIRRGHPGRMLACGVIVAGLAWAVVAVFPAVSRLVVAAVAGASFVLSSREDMASRPGNGNDPGWEMNEPGERGVNASGGASGSRMEQGPPAAFWP